MGYQWSKNRGRANGGNFMLLEEFLENINDAQAWVSVSSRQRVVVSSVV